MEEMSPAPRDGQHQSDMMLKQEQEMQSTYQTIGNNQNLNFDTMNFNDNPFKNSSDDKFTMQFQEEMGIGTGEMIDPPPAEQIYSQLFNVLDTEQKE